MNCGVGLARAILKRFKGHAVFERKAFIYTAHNLAHGFRNGLTRSAAVVTDSLRNVTVRNKFGSVGINEAFERLRSERKLFKVGI